VRPDLIELSKTVDAGALGARLRSARLRAGLTQSQVAGSDLSTAYVSRIEAGQRRPDPTLLEAMAARLDVPVEELLVGASPDRIAELRLALDLAHLSLAGGDAVQARARADAVLAELDDVGGLPDLRRQAADVRAFALEANGDLDAAILALEERVGAEPFDLAWLEAMTALSRCYRESGDLVAAVEVGDRAAGYIAEHQLDGLSEAVALTLTVAAAHFERGDVAHASRLCQRALAQADEHGSAESKAAAYWNASVMESKAGHPEVALDLASKALGIFEAGEDGRNLARLRTQVGILQLRMDPPEPRSALAVLTQAQAELGLSSASRADRADNLLAQARAHFLLEHHERTDELIAATLEEAGGRTPLVAADARLLQGQVLAGHGAVGEAARAYREAILLLSGVGADRGAAQTWFELGGLLDGLGDQAGALDAFRRAAASTGLVSTRTRSSVAGSTTP
jgi:transcriptional regulator with XRE-family HTH domain